MNFSPLFFRGSSRANMSRCYNIHFEIFSFYFSLVETYPSLHFMRHARTHSILKLICSIMKLSEEGKKNIQQSILFHPLLYNVTALILLGIHKSQSFPKGIPLFVANFIHFCFDHHSIHCFITIFFLVIDEILSTFLSFYHYIHLLMTLFHP